CFALLDWSSATAAAIAATAILRAAQLWLRFGFSCLIMRADRVRRCYSPATASLGRLLLPYLFPKLSTFTTVEDLVSHLRASDARYRAAVPAEFLDRNPPPMYITLYFIVTRLPESLRSVRDHFLSLDPTSLTVDLLEQHLLAAETSAVAVGAARGTPRPPFFEGAKRRSSKGKGGRGGGGGSGSGGGGCSGGGGGGGTVGGSGGSGGGGGGSGGSGGSGGGGTGSGGAGARRIGSGGGQRQQQQRRSKTPSPQQLREWFQRGASGGSCPYVIRTGDHAGQTCGRLHTQHRCFSRLDDAWRAEFGDDVELPRWADLLKSRIAIFDLDFDAILSTITTLTPLLAPVPVRLADPSGGPVVACSSTVLSCPSVPSGSLSGLHLPSFSMNLPPLARVASLPHLRGMHSRLLVSSLPRSLPPLSPSPAPPCLPCLEGRQCAAPHSSSFPPTAAPLQTLHMDVWGLAHVSGQSCECYFLLVVDDYTRYTTVFPLRSKGQVVDVLIPWIRTVRLQLRERFGQDLPVLRLHSDRGGEFSSNLLWEFCRGEGILQSFTLPDSPQQNGIAEHRIGLGMEVARTSMIHAAAPNFLWLFAIQYNAHQLNLWPRVSLPETSPTLRWMGEVCHASVLRFYHPTSSRVFPSQDVTFDESVPFYSLFPYHSAPPPPSPLFLAPDPLPCPAPVQVAVDSSAARGAASGGAASGGIEPGGAEYEGAKTRGAEPGGVETRGAEPGGVATGGGEPRGAEPEDVEIGSARSEGAESGGAEPQGAAFSGASGAGGACPAGARGPEVAAGAGVSGGTASTGPGGARTRGTGASGTSGVEGTGVVDLTEFGTTGAGGAGAGGAGVGGPGAGGTGVGGPGVGGAGAGGAGAADPGGAVRPRPYFVHLLQQVLGTPPSAALYPPLLCPPPDQSQPPLQPASPLPAPFPYTEQSGGLTEHREPTSRPVSPVRTARRIPRSRPPPVLGTHAMTHRPSSVPLLIPLPAPPESSLLESAAASALVAELLEFAAACHLDYATALVAESVSASPPSVGGECALGMNVLEDRQEDFESLATAVPRFASMLLAPEGDPDAPDIPTPRSYADAITGTYVDEVPPPGANIVDGMWIFRVKRPSGSPPAFKVRYVARGLSQRQGVNYFHTFSPTQKMTTLRVLLHVAAQRDYELLSLDFSTTFLEGSLHEEIWLRRPPGFPETTLAAFGFAPATTDPSLFLRTDTSLLPFYVLVYVLQRFGFQFSSPQPTPLSTSHSVSAPPSDESVQPSGPYPELEGCLMYVMTCTRPDLAYPLSLLAHFVAPATQRSSQGYTFSLGSGSISLRSTRSSSVLSSSCEAEIYARAMAAQELRWLTYLLTDLGEQSRSPAILLEHRTKHIALRYFLARELQQRGQLRLAYVASEANTADIFTKALAPGDHQRFCTMLACFALLDWSCFPTCTQHSVSSFIPVSSHTRANTADVFTKALPAGDDQRFVTVLGLLALLFLTGLVTLLFSPILPMG
ncbi:unnamed protein product, partial [Closterium sp. NIES-53]